MPPSPSKPRFGLSTVPVFWQLLGLCLLVLILSLIINAALILFSPPPQPSGYSLREAVQAIERGEVKLPNGKWLRAQTEAKAPAVEKQGRGREAILAQIIREKLAKKLNLTENRVTVVINDKHPPFGRSLWQSRQMTADGRPKIVAGGWSEPQGPVGVEFRGEIRGEIRGENPDERNGAQLPLPAEGAGAPDDRLFRRVPDEPFDGRVIVGPGPGGPPRFENFRPVPSGGPSGGPNGGNARFNAAQGFDEQINFPPFTAVIHQANGKYRVLVPPRNWLEPWQWRLLLGMGLTAACIAPLAFVLSRRLSAPMVALAKGAAEMEFGPQASPVDVKGPREVRAAAEALNAMQVRLKTYVDNRTALITAIAHDLKTPLARLRLRAETLPSEHRDKVNADIGHMNDLIGSALSFADADRRSLRLAPLDLPSLIESLCEDISELQPVKLGEIDYGLTISGDATALKRILTNLIENAFRYGGDAEVTVTTDSASNMAEVIVRDNGPGLPEDMLEAVFEPFFRLESSRNRDTGGVGLGLSLARKLTEAHDGTLTLRNRVQDGAIVGLDAIVRLPKWAKS